MTECHNTPRAFQHPDVYIGWYPYRVKGPTAVRTAPSPAQHVGRTLKIVPTGGGVAVQSIRNPRQDPLPPRRPSYRGYIWVYTRNGAIQGWAPATEIEPDPQAASKPALDGPAGYDFEVGRTLPSGTKKPNGCGDVSPTKPVRYVIATDTYLRYSARGTAFHYLHSGDSVRILHSNCPGGFAFVEVLHSISCPDHTRGYVLHESLSSESDISIVTL